MLGARSYTDEVLDCTGRKREVKHCIRSPVSAPDHDWDVTSHFKLLHLDSSITMNGTSKLWAWVNPFSLAFLLLYCFTTTKESKTTTNLVAFMKTSITVKHFLNVGIQRSVVHNFMCAKLSFQCMDKISSIHTHESFKLKENVWIASCTIGITEENSLDWMEMPPNRHLYSLN